MIFNMKICGPFSNLNNTITFQLGENHTYHTNKNITVFEEM